MLVVGLTGSIAMGKTTAAAHLRSRGVPVFDADECVHEIYKAEAVPLIEAAFPGTTDAAGVNRVRLSEALQREPAAFKRLEAIVHPLVGHKQRAFLRRAALAGEKLVVLDIPLLFEGMGERRVDATLVVSAPAFLQRRRVLARPGMTTEKFEGILRQQVPDSLKRRKASIVIPTGMGLAPTRAALGKAVAELRGLRGQFWPPNPWREKFTARLARARRK